MKRNRKKSSTRDRPGPSTSTRDRPGPSTSTRAKEENDLAFFVHDRVGLMREVFSVLKPKELKAIAPECVRKLSIDNLEELCLEELLGISSKRLCAILDGAEPPSDTESSSSDSSKSSEPDRSPPKAACEEVICLDSESNDSSVQSKKRKKRKKKHKKRKRKSTETTTQSDESQQTESTDQTAQNTTKNTKNKQLTSKNKSAETNTSTAAILDNKGGNGNENSLPRVPGKEKSRAAERVGMTVLEIIELQARARAIRAQMAKGNQAVSQAGPSSSSTTAVQQSSVEVVHSDSEVEIKEEAAEVVNLLTSSDDEEEEKPKVEELQVAVQKEPDPPPATSKEKIKANTKISKKSLNTDTVAKEPENSNEKTKKPKKKKKNKISETQNSSKASVSDSKDTVPDKNTTKKKQDEANAQTEQVTVAAVECIEQPVKVEQEISRESSPDLIIIEDTDLLKENNQKDAGKSSKPSSNDVTPKKILETHQNAQNNANIRSKTNKSVVKSVTASKSGRENDFTVTVSNTKRKVNVGSNNYVISVSNDPSLSQNKDDSVDNTFVAQTRRDNPFYASTDNPINKSAKKLNSTVTKILNEKSKAKYLKSVVQKTTNKDKPSDTSKKERDKRPENLNKEKAVSSKNKDRSIEKDKVNKAKEKDKEYDHDEITLQLSDSEKMDLLEDLIPKSVAKSVEHSSYSAESSDDGTSSSSCDESEHSVISTEKTNNKNNDQDSLNDSNINNSTQDINTADAINVPLESPKTSAEICPTDEEEKQKKSDSIEETCDDISDVIKESLHSSNSNLKLTEIDKETFTVTKEIEMSNISVSNIISNLRKDEISLEVTDKAQSNKNVVRVPETDSLDQIDVEESNNGRNNNLELKALEVQVKVIDEEASSENLIEIRSIRDIPILPEYESDYEHPKTLENVELSAATEHLAKDLSETDKTGVKKSKKRKKGKQRLSESTNSNTLIDTVTPKPSDITEKIVDEENASVTKDGDISNKYNIADNKSGLENTNVTNADEETDLSQKQEISAKSTREIEDTNETHALDTNSDSFQTEKNPIRTDEEVSETSDNNESKNRETNKLSKTNNDLAITNESESKMNANVVCETNEDQAETEESNLGTSEDQNGRTKDDSSAETHENRSAPVMIIVEGENNTIIEDVGNTAESTKEVDLEEGEIMEEHRQGLSEGEITTSSDSEIEAQDIRPETICISDEDEALKPKEDKNRTKAKEKVKKKEKKPDKKAKKSKRKDFREDADENFYRNTDDESVDITSTDKVVVVAVADQCSKETIYKEKNASKSAKIVFKSDVNKQTVTNNIILDSDDYNTSDSDSDETPNKTLKTDTKTLAEAILNTDNNEKIVAQDIASCYTYVTDSDTLETYEISDDSSDCYEILSKEPTTEEIEALSAKIDQIDRIDVATNDEILEHELDNSFKDSPNNFTAMNKNNEIETNSDRKETASTNKTVANQNDLPLDENRSWRDRYKNSKKVKKVLTTANILNALRKKNLELKKRLLESKILKPEEIVPENVVEKPLEIVIGSIEHYNTLESSTKYVDPVNEPEIKDDPNSNQTGLEDAELTTVPAEVGNNEPTLVNTDTENEKVTKEMKKDAKQLYKMYKRLLKYNDMFKERNPEKKKKKKRKKSKDEVASSSNVAETT